MGHVGAIGPALEYCRECAAGSAGRNACGAAGSEAICEEGQVIGKKLVDRYAHQSGVKDQLVAEREVVLTCSALPVASRKTLISRSGRTTTR